MKADSTLVSPSAVIYSPNNSGKRMYAITRVSVHCVVGQTTAESLGYFFADPDIEASSNYGVGYDGKIGQYLPESYRSWCTSNGDNDNRAITIEVASDTFEPYKVKDAAYKALINLLVDICKRHGKKKLIWIPDKNKALAYAVKNDELLMTVHRWFANKSCPGTYLYNLHSQIATEVTKALGGVTPTPTPTPTPATKPAAGQPTSCTLTFAYLGKDWTCNVSGQVRTVQRILNTCNYKGKDGKALTLDGVYGDNTEYAVIAYQKKHNLTADGVVGPATWKALTGAK